MIPAIGERVGAIPAGREIADFEEYTWLYEESWGDPAIRWLLSSLPSAMIFDEDAPATDGPIGYDLVVKIKGHPVFVGERWFTDLDEARLHALDFVLEIYEEEMKALV